VTRVVDTGAGGDCDRTGKSVPNRCGVRVVAAVAAVAVAALVTSGCSSSSAHKKSSPTPTQPSTSASTSPLVQKSLPDVSKIKNDPTKRKAVALTTCRATHGGWLAGGSITNPHATMTTYRITVFFTTATATALDYARATVKVAAKAKKTWQAAATFARPSGVLCVLVRVS
jgi:PBP1b-binding outer membrane lipoprotein LpoB